MQSLYGAIANTNKKEIMVSINNVYQKVLALANKEQRGYITPQEFNLFADHAQMEIFEQYFYNLEQRQRGVGNDLDYASMQSNIEEKISMFEDYDQAYNNDSALPAEVYKLGMVRALYNGQKITQAEQIQLKELSAGNSPLTKWNKSRPVYTMISSTTGINRIKVYPSPNELYISYIKKPISPNWTYVIHEQSALYNPNGIGHQDFELHSSEENALVIKILQLAGVAIKDFNLVQVAGQKEASIIQQEKQ